MKLSVIALDYDGTIAQHDRLSSVVRDAIAEARTRGILVVLVTGRILTELQRVAGDLHFVDGVVAENGAVIHFPASDYTTVIGSAIPAGFVEDLTRRGVAFVAGRCLLDCAADDAPRLLSAIRESQQPLVLAFNHGRVMVLSQGVSKATGLSVALAMLRLSPRNTVAVGDAENDHPLLQLAELGAAVAWGSRSLREAADVEIAGGGPPAVAEFIRLLAATGRVPLPAKPRRRLRLGYTEDGREFSLAVKGRNVLIAGDARSGKSWVAGLMCEQLILHGYSMCIIDPEGDYRSLESLPGVTVLGGEDPPPTPRDLLRALRYPDRSVVIDLSHHQHDEKIEYTRALLPALSVMRRRTGLPHRILLDEAHYFLHGAAAEGLLDLKMNGYTVVTYCASRLPAELLAATEVMLVTCESNPAEIDALFRRCVTCQAIEGARSGWAALAHLSLGQAMVLPITDESDGQLKMFSIGQRLTPHVRHRAKYVDVPVTEGRAFQFAANGTSARRTRTLRQFVEALESTSASSLAPYVRRGDFSRWIGDVFGDYALAKELQTEEQRYRAREDPDVVPEMVGAIRARYDLAAEDNP